LEWVRIINFQKHEDLTVPFTDGLNVMTGESSTGKTGVYRSLEWLYGFSSISFEDLRREGSDSTSVIAKLKSGFEVEKYRTNSTNRYLLRKEGCKEEVYDNVGINVPEKIRQVLGFDVLEFDKINLNVNFASQDDLNFIFDAKIPASFNAKLFNFLTGNSILDQVFQACNKENFNINRDLKALEGQIDKQVEDVELCTKQYTELNARLQNVKEIYAQIEDKLIIYDELKKLATKLKENKEAKDFVSYKLSKIVKISEDKIKELQDKAIRLKELLIINSKLTSVYHSLQQVIENQKKIKIPDVNFEDLKQKATIVSELALLKAKLQTNKSGREKVDFLKSKLKIPAINLDVLKDKVTILNELSNLSKKMISNKKDTENITLQKTENAILLGKLITQLKETWSNLEFCEKCKPIAEKLIIGEKK
jgi:hypothetical protein